MCDQGVHGMGPGDDAPIVGEESAQSSPTRDVSYTHLNAMNPKDEAVSTENVCCAMSLIRVFTSDSFMYKISQVCSFHCGAFLPNISVTITLRNADVWRMAALKLAKGRPQPYINLYETYKEIYGQAH